MRFRRWLWPTIEKKLYDWVVNERAKGMRISTVRVLQESKRIAQEDNIKDFKAYPSWVFGFMKRNNLSVLDKNYLPTGKLKWQNFVCMLEKTF